jgi:anti-sigma B factor antagonist
MISFLEHEHGDVTQVVVQGQLTAEAETQFLARNEDLVSRGKIRVVLDLAGIHYIDSSGIGVIVSLFKRVRLQNGDVKLANLGGQPREIFRLLRLDKAFELYDSLEGAVAAFRNPG